MWPPAAAEPVGETVSLEGAALRGNAAAKLAMIVFTDYECPFCRKFELETQPVLEERYVQTGKLRVAIRHNPLQSIHPHALGAAVAATCAGRQGAFWPFHGRLFAAERIDEDVITRAASESGLDPGGLAACRAGADAVEIVRAEAAGAAALGLNSTPSFLIGRIQNDGLVSVGAVLRGARPAAEFQRVIDDLFDERGPIVSAAQTTAVIVVVALGAMGLWLRRARRRARGEAIAQV